MATARTARVGVALCCLLLVASSAGASAKSPISWQPEKLVPGSPVLIQVSADAAARSVTADFLGHEFEVFRTTGNVWEGLGGVPVETKPGLYEVVVHKRDGKSAGVITLRRTIRISPAHYPKIAVQVAKQFTEPNPEQVKDIASDKDVKEKIFSESSAQRTWAGSFQPPVSVAVSGVFGTERVFNGQVQSRHQGLDFAAPVGTPVLAINSGIVILARQMFFEGNWVVIDHGQGLMSLYLHLSGFNVKEGDTVEKGQQIGLSGGSGRATGPHLHLAIRWQGVYLDPAILLKLRIP